jgi:hypothetical protein
MQKGVDAIAIGVIALGVVLLIVLFVVSNNMMPEPLPPVQMPDLASVRANIENPLGGGGSACWRWHGRACHGRLRRWTGCGCAACSARSAATLSRRIGRRDGWRSARAAHGRTRRRGDVKPDFAEHWQCGAV